MHVIVGLFDESQVQPDPAAEKRNLDGAGPVVLRQRLQDISASDESGQTAILIKNRNCVATAEFAVVAG